MYEISIHHSPPVKVLFSSQTFHPADTQTRVFMQLAMENTPKVQPRSELLCRKKGMLLDLGIPSARLSP